MPIAEQRTTYAPPPEQISHLRQVRNYESKIIQKARTSQKQKEANLKFILLNLRHIT